MSDDVYQEFKCAGGVNVQYVDSGNVVLGIARCLAFMMFLGFQSYNKVLLNKKQANNVNVIRGLILPSYLPFIYFYMAFSACTGLIDLINQATYQSRDFDSFVYPVEIGITHWFLEGLAIFLMRYGAGIQAIRRSLRISFVWGLFTSFWFLIIFAIMNRHIHTNNRKSKLYGMFISYEVVVFVFYTIYAFVPAKYLYYRPALRFYARFSSLSTAIVIIFGTLYHKGVYDIICPGSVVAFIFAAFLQPLAIFKTLQIDSQYWQGLSPEQGNPLTEVWDHLGIETASTMAEHLEQFGRNNRKLPILHFGLMNFDRDLKFVAGGFSRVYFGTMRGERVAFKILFAMELDPKDVEEFYREAAVLHTLQHANVVQCLGVCVMPPALTIVLELCKHGSLFDFLYKPVALPKPRQSLTGMIRASLIGTRNSLLGITADDLEGLSTLTGTGNSGAVELRSMTEMEPSFSNPLGKATDEGWRTLSISTRDSNASDRDTVTNPMGNLSTGGSMSAPGGSTRPFSNGRNLMAHIHSTAQDGDHPSDAPHEKGSPNMPAAAVPKGLGGDSSAGSSLDELDKTVTKASAGSSGSVGATHVPVNISSAAAPPSNSPGVAGRGSSGGMRKQGSGRIMAMMQAPFERLNSADVTPRPSSVAPRAPLGASTTYNQRLRMMRDAIAGIAFLHSQGYMHCDLKSLNFLVAEDYVLKLADMGEARKISSPPKRDVPPIPARNWAPPEVLVEGARADAYTVHSDIYGLSIILAEIITAELPFGEQPNLVPVQRWHQLLTVENLRPSLPECLPTPLRAIIRRGWSTTPSERPSAAEMLDVIDQYVLPAGRSSEGSSGDDNAV